MNIKHNKINKKKYILLAGLGLVFLAFCSLIFISCATSDNSEVVKIAVAGPESRMNGEFKNGIELAVDEINEKEYLKNKKIEVEYFDDKRDLSTGIEVAQTIAKDADDYVAVIGHWNAFINIPVASIYDDAQLTSITPMVSSPSLTQNEDQYIFRLVPTDRDEAQRMAAYAKKKGYEKIAVCYTDSDYGRGLAKEFVSACDERGIKITDSHSDFINQNDFNRQYDKWSAMETQAVFIADSLPYAKELIEYIRVKSKDLPILSAGGFSFDDVIALVGKDSEGIVYTALYNPSTKLKAQKLFNKKYNDKYGEKPESFLAGKGYESIYIVAHAVKKANSTDSTEIAQQLHKIKKWKGIGNKYSFKSNGDPKGIKLYIVEVNGKSLQYK